MIIFRIDLGHRLGLGHYTRIKSLIGYLGLKKYKIVIDKFPDNFYLKQEEENIISLYKKNTFFKNELSDANLFLKLLKNKYISPVVIKDSYRLNYLWEKKIYKFCKKVISIDDFVTTKHHADVYINHNPAFSNDNGKLLKQLKYKNKKNCSFLIGPDFALFNSSYKKNEKVISDFVFYNGGSGNLLVYEKIIKKLSKTNKKKFKIVFLVGPYSSNYRSIYLKFNKYKNIKIINHPNNILKFLNGTKIFISSAGISMFESSFLKVPTLLFKMNNNQNLSEFDYENLGHYFSLEKKDLKQSDKIVNLIYLMLKNRSQIKKMMFASRINTNYIKKNYQRNLKF